MTLAARLPRTYVAPRFAGHQRLTSVEQQVPMPGHGQLLIEVRANAICGTDRGLWEAGCGVVPGHEAAGVVIARGPGTSVPVGALGVVYLMAFCGECRSCRLGLANRVPGQARRHGIHPRRRVRALRAG